MSARTCSVRRLTPTGNGAVAIIEVSGPGADDVLATLTRGSSVGIGEIRLLSIAAIDQALIAKIDAERIFLMPHGGEFIAQQIERALLDAGCTREGKGAAVTYPEAASRVESIVLRALSMASSPRLAVPLLLEQTERWSAGAELALHATDLERSQRLNHLLSQPRVVVAGVPNVGKSTLTNRLLGRELAIVSAIAGTTRDYSQHTISLNGLIVNWIDTPGLRDRKDAIDPIEAAAIAIVSDVIEQCDCLIAMSDHEHNWPLLPRSADLAVINKCDVGGDRSKSSSPSRECIAISALTGLGIEVLVAAVNEFLVPGADREHPGRWLFDEALGGVQ
ncbi:MAG: GTPase [Phycisphaerales bacterium]